MSLDVFGDSGASYQNIFDAIYYATDNGARVINMSLGAEFEDFSMSLLELYYSDIYYGYINALQYAVDNGACVVIAAGNSQLTTADDLTIPAAFSDLIPGVISVASVGNTNDVASYSNYGNMLTIAAPGGDWNARGAQILSTTPGNNYEQAAGTSMAAPIVSGAISLVLAENPTLSPAEVEEILVSSADKFSSLEGFVNEGSFLNVYDALLMSQDYEGSFVPDDSILDIDGDGFVDEVTNYQMWTESGGVDLTNRRGKTFSDDTSRLWDLTKAVEVDSGFTILLEGDRSKEGKYRVVNARDTGVISGATPWATGRKLAKFGYEEIFDMDFNGNDVVDVV